MVRTSVWWCISIFRQLELFQVGQPKKISGRNCSLFVKTTEILYLINLLKYFDIFWQSECMYFCIWLFKLDNIVQFKTDINSGPAKLR